MLPPFNFHEPVAIIISAAWSFFPSPLYYTMPLRVYAKYIEYFDNHQQFLLLLAYLARLRHLILLSDPGESHGPEQLPANVLAYLEDWIKLEPRVLARLWIDIRPYIHTLSDTDYRREVDDSFRMTGRAHGIGGSDHLQSIVHSTHFRLLLGAENLSPPTLRCIRPECPVPGGGLLAVPITVECRLYSLHRGVLPLQSTSTYCAGTHHLIYQSLSTFNHSFRNSPYIISLSDTILAQLFRSQRG